MQKRIYKLSDEDYAALAEQILARLSTPCYFTGVVETEGACGEALRLTASLILYRRRQSKLTPYDTIYSVMPVWWDFVCEDEEGVVYDDFDFDRFKSFLIEEE